MTKAQKKDLFTEWALYEPVEQRLVIDEYLPHQCGKLQQGTVFVFSER